MQTVYLMNDKFLDAGHKPLDWQRLIGQAAAGRCKVRIAMGQVRLTLDQLYFLSALPGDTVVLPYYSGTIRSSPKTMLNAVGRGLYVCLKESIQNPGQGTLWPLHPLGRICRMLRNMGGEVEAINAVLSDIGDMRVIAYLVSIQDKLSFHTECEAAVNILKMQPHFPSFVKQSEEAMRGGKFEDTYWARALFGADVRKGALVGDSKFSEYVNSMQMPGNGIVCACMFVLRLLVSVSLVELRHPEFFCSSFLTMKEGIDLQHEYDNAR